MTRSSRVHRIAGALLAAAVILGPVTAWAFSATLTIPALCASPVPVLAFGLETSNTLSSGSGGGGGAGKATIKPLVLTKGVDDCTPLLFKAAFTGQHFPTATLQVGTNKGTLFTIQLTDLIVTDVKHEFAKASQGSDDGSVSCNQATNTCQ